MFNRRSRQSPLLPRHGVFIAVALLLVLRPEAGRAALSEPSAASSGALAIESDPSGANVYVDGRFAGLTPLSLTKMSRGDHRVRLVKDGYLENARVVTAGVEGARVVRVKLTRHEGSNDDAASQVMSGAGGGGSKKKWIWIGAAAAGAGAGVYAATHRNAAPNVSGVVLSPNVALASVTSIGFTANAVDPDGDSLTYTWDFGDGSTGSGQTTAHVYNNAGSFSAIVTVSDGKKSASGSGTATVRSISGTWAGNLGSNPNVFFTMSFSQGGSSFAGTYSDTISGVGTVTAGRLTSPLQVAFTAQLPGFAPVNFTGALDPAMNRISGSVVGYAGGPNTFYLDRR